jgi:hypothetical protein
VKDNKGQVHTVYAVVPNSLSIAKFLLFIDNKWVWDDATMYGGCELRYQPDVEVEIK